ncbi:MAG: DUF2971 domain-containing protein [Sphingobacteriaceae bacterium]|nr:MAG: DUF2971 domain-containing protein [Sphingobacteriaceae bacterium]
MSDLILQSYKKQFYCASFSSIDSIDEEDFSMWRLYGLEGKGVALIFEVENKDDDWHHFTIGKVQYGLGESSERYKEFIKFFDEFQKNNNFPIRNRPITSTAFLALHKNIGWQYENEVRLLSHYGYNDYTLKPDTRSNLLTKIYHSYNNSFGHYTYLELPLVGSTEYERLNTFFAKDDMKDLHSKFRSMLPRLKLAQVILGYQYSGREWVDLKRVINYEADKHPSLNFSTVLSKFSDHG